MKRLTHKTLTLVLIIIFVLMDIGSVYAAVNRTISTVAQAVYPLAVAVDKDGNIYIADRDIGYGSSNENCGQLIKRDPEGNYLSTLSFDCGRFDALAVDKDGNVYAAYTYGNKIIKIDTNRHYSVVAGTGTPGYGGDNRAATEAQLYWPFGLALDSSENIYIADGRNNVIRKVDKDGIITTVAGTGTAGYLGDGGSATEAQLKNPRGLAVDSSGNIYIADAGNNVIRKVDKDGIITTVAGNGNRGNLGDGGAATEAQLNLRSGGGGSGLAVDSSGNIYIACDNFTHVIRMVDKDGIITTVAGNGTRGYSGDGGSATEAQLNDPRGLAVDSSGNIYIADSSNRKIRKVRPPSVLDSVAISGSIPTLIVGRDEYDLANLTIAGIDQYGDSYDITGETITWAIESGNSYVSLNSNILKPVSAGSGTLTATVNGITSDPVSFTVTSATIITNSLPFGVVETPYQAELEATGGTAPYTWSSTVLPDGLELNSTTGAISWTPDDTGTYNLTVTVEDDNGIKDTVDYTLTIAQSLAIDLANLTINPGTLSPAFNKNIVTYHVNTDVRTSVAIIAELADPNATLTIAGISVKNDDKKIIEKTIELEDGKNLIPIVVTSPDGNTQKAYVISVNGKVSNADLKSLTVSGAAINFDEDINVSVDNKTEKIDISASPSDTKALVLIDGKVRTCGAIDLDVGKNPIDIMVVAQDASTKTYTVTVNKEAQLGIETERLPIGIVNKEYSEITLEASGGSEAYTWEVVGLPQGLDYDSSGRIYGTPEVEFDGNITVTVTDVNNKISISKPLRLKINLGCGNGGYLITPDSDVAYTEGMTDDGFATMTVNTMTVNQGISGFKYFSVTVEPVKEHTGNEVAVFVHMRNGKEIGINATRADFDTTNNAQAAFNIQAGDVIIVYIVDELTNDSDKNPKIL